MYGLPIAHARRPIEAEASLGTLFTGIVVCCQVPNKSSSLRPSIKMLSPFATVRTSFGPIHDCLGGLMACVEQADTLGPDRSSPAK